MMLSLLFLLVLCWNTSFAFTLRLHPQSPSSSSLPYGPTPSRRLASGTTEPSSTSPSLNEISQQLLDRLLSNYFEKGGEGLTTQKDPIIESLLYCLIQAQVTFDPEICFTNDELYFVVYQTQLDETLLFQPTVDTGKTDLSTTTITTNDEMKPIWAQWALDTNAIVNNRQGQQYSMVQDNDDENDNNDRVEVTNYGELWGRNAHIRVFGEAYPAAATTAKEEDDQMEETSSEESTTNERGFFRILQGLLSSSSSRTAAANKTNNDSKTLLQCPVDYNVQANGAVLTLTISQEQQKPSWEIPLSFIRGKGKLRILYADPQLRIFIVPQDNDNGGIRERQGFTVCQIKSRQIDPNLTRLS